jgi:hypothetical protein
MKVNPQKTLGPKEQAEKDKRDEEERMLPPPKPIDPEWTTSALQWGKGICRKC